MKRVSILILILSLYSFATSFERITNYASTVCINDFESAGNLLYVASSGGLYVFNKSTQKGTLLPNASSNPDPNIKALCFDNQFLWTGSDRGYLAKRTSAGESVYLSNSHFTSKWFISDIVHYKGYLLIASSNGLSIFNTSKLYSDRNATKFGTLTSYRINTLKLYNDTLYCGLENGIAKLYLGGSFDKINFYDPAIWNTTEVESPVKSFSIQNGIKAFSGPSDNYGNQVLHATDSTLYLNNNVVANLHSKITAIKVVSPTECWIGTEDYYFQRWDGKTFTKYTIPGPTMTTINKIYVDHTGKMWYLPYGVGYYADNNKIIHNSPWWIGVGSFENNNWCLYNYDNIPDMGRFGDNPENSGIIETRDNRMWFGTSGGQIKTYTPSKNSWMEYQVYSQEYGSLSSGTGNNGWGKVDAFTIDSSGYLWISSWDNYIGSLICYDYRFEPDRSQSDFQKAHFRMFFPLSDQNHAQRIMALNTDKNGNIIAGSEDGKIIVFNHNGNPLSDSINIVKTSSFSNCQIFDMVTAADLNTYIMTNIGIYTFDPIYKTITKIDTMTSRINAAAVENGNIIWLATDANGLIRYDIANDIQTTISSADGLIANCIKSIAIDRVNGYLWAASDTGFSKIDLGYRTDHAPKPNDLEVYPNPYSKSKSKTGITIRNVPSNSKIAIYSFDGKKIDVPELVRSGNGAIYHWEPSKNLSIGTYFVLAGKKPKPILITP